jgi:hypothetical protein
MGNEKRTYEVYEEQAQAQGTGRHKKSNDYCTGRSEDHRNTCFAGEAFVPSIYPPTPLTVNSTKAGAQHTVPVKVWVGLSI